MEVVVLAVVTLTPWAFGGVDPVFELVLAAAMALLLSLWAALAIASGRFTLVRCPVTAVLALILLVGVIQLLPLPAGLLGWVSPGAGDLRTKLYADPPEQLTPTEAAAGAPSWPTITVYPHATRAELFRWLSVIVLFAAVRNQIATTNSLWRLSLVMLLSGCVLALFGLVQFFSDRTKVYWSFKTEGYPFGPFINRNHFAAYLNLCIALGVGLLVWLGPSEIDRKRRYMVKPNAPTEQGEELASVFSPFTVLHSPPQLWTCVGLALMVAAVMCSVSRGGVATLLLALLITTLLRMSWPIRFRRLEVLIVPALLLIGLFAWVGFRPLETRLGAALRGADDVGQHRFRIWAGLLELVPRFPLFGSGYGTLGYVEPMTRRPDAFGEPNTFLEHAHNDYLEALVEGGVLRAGLTLLLVGLVFAAGYRGLRRYSGRTPAALAVGAMAGFLAIAAHSAVDFSITTPAVAVLAAVVVAQLVSVARSDPTKPPAAARGRVVSLRLGPVSRVAVALAALSVGGILVLHAWQADRAHRYRLAAFRAVHPAKGASPKAADLDQAVTYLEAAVQVMPDDADVRSDLGQVYLDRGHEREARVIDELRRWRVGLVIGAGSTEGAVAAVATWPWRDHLRAAPGRNAHDLRAVVFDDAVLPALRQFALARQLCPLIPRPHMRFAAHAGELVRADAPDKYWDRSILLAPFDPDLRFFAGLQLLREGHVDEAWKQWRKSLELMPKPVWDQQRAKLHDRLTAIVAASVPYLGSDPRRRGQLLLERVLPDRPEDLVEAARILDPTLAPNGPARPLLDRALALLTERPEGLFGEDAFLKGQIQEALGDDDAAIRAYKQALIFVGAKPEWRVQLVKLLMAKGRWSEALAELNTLDRQIPNNPQVKDWIGEANRELLNQ